MKKPRFVTHALSTLAMAWIVGVTPAAGQMRIMIDEILLSDHGQPDMFAAGPRVAVDGSGQWLKLRSRTDDRAGRDAGMAELLKFDVAETLAAFGSAPRLSADDYRFAVTAFKGAQNWDYDDDPLDRGVYKRELGPATTAHRAGVHRTSHGGRGSHAAHAGATPGSSVDVAAGPMEALSPIMRTAPSNETVGIVKMMLRTPHYVVKTMKSVYGSDYALMAAAGLFIVIVGLAALMDMLRAGQRA